MSGLTLPLSPSTPVFPGSLIEHLNTSVYHEESSLVSEALRLIQLLHQSPIDDIHISFYLGVSAAWSPLHGDESPTTNRIREVYHLVRQFAQSSNFDIFGFSLSPETDDLLRSSLLSIGSLSRAVRVPVYRLPNELFFLIVRLVLQDRTHPGALPWRLLCVSRHCFITMMREPSFWSDILLPGWYHDHRGLRALTWRMTVSYPLLVHLKCSLETFLSYSTSTEGLNTQRLVSLTLETFLWPSDQSQDPGPLPCIVLPELLYLHIYQKVSRCTPDEIERLKRGAGLTLLRNLHAPKLACLKYRGLCPSTGLPETISETVSELEITSYCRAQLEPETSAHYRWHKEKWDSILQLPNLRRLRADLGPFQRHIRGLSDQQATPAILMPNLETFTVRSSCINSPPILAPKLQSLSVLNDRDARERFSELKGAVEFILSHSQFSSPELHLFDFPDA
ncbi:hypothetical protein DL96DRAFT_1816875 [Flagelloscypha sp. PMI_526]|nr:hypothetical protein DL96DRAFT_1816875 [Flagelloscypha sp. PMI_526]